MNENRDIEQVEQRDVVVVGGGAAGLSAALLLGRARRSVLVVDAGAPRNRFAAHMHGVLGHEGIDPAALLERGRSEAAGYGVEVRPGQVERADEDTDGVTVTLADGRVVRTRALVVATGLSDVLPDVPGLAEHWGTRVLHCPYCHGWEVRDQHLGVLTTSPLAMHQAELIRQWSDRVTVFTAGLGPLDEPTERRLRSRGSTLVPAAVTKVSAEAAGGLVVHTDDGGETAVDAIFTAGTPRPHDAFLDRLGLDRTESPFGSYLAVDPAGRTSSARIWAVGNVVNPMANVPMSVGAGAMTGGAVNAALVTWDFDAAVAAAPPTSWPEVATAEFWEERYASTDRTWSGRPNHSLAAIAADLPRGQAVDLGSGEGGDAIWLAQQGWTVTGLDVSPTAVARATAAARGAGLPSDRLRFEAVDVATWYGGPYDLVTTSFLHAPASKPRTEMLRHAAGLVAPGGHLLVVSHAGPPSWARPEQHQGHRFLTPDEAAAALDLDPQEWTVLLAENRSRTATGPDGEEGELDDSVLLLRRR